jgi:hypothetical protein
MYRHTRFIAVDLSNNVSRSRLLVFQLFRYGSHNEGEDAPAPRNKAWMVSYTVCPIYPLGKGLPVPVR